MQIGHDPRVRYSPTLGVWTVDMQTMTYMGGAEQVLAAAMHYAREAGELPECACFPEVSSEVVGLNPRVEGTPPQTHKVYRQSAFTIYGHGTLAEGSEVGANRDALNAIRCPLANAEGEREAKRLAHEDTRALWDATVPFPALPQALTPAEPGAKAPKVWEGEPMQVGRASVPARHVHPQTRADMARLAALIANVDGLDRAARAAQIAADEAPIAARREVAEKAAAGQAVDAASITKLVRERREEADAAKAVADGTRDALEAVRREVAQGIGARRDEWLGYLHAQASHGLARLDLVLAELASSLADLAEIDRVRQTVEKASAASLFSSASQVEMGRAVPEAQEARDRAATALSSLARHAARAARAGTPETAPAAR